MLLGLAVRAMDCAGKNSTGIFARLEDLFNFQVDRFVFLGFPTIMTGYRNMPGRGGVARIPGGQGQADLTFLHEKKTGKPSFVILNADSPCRKQTLQSTCNFRT